MPDRRRAAGGAPAARRHPCWMRRGRATPSTSSSRSCSTRGCGRCPWPPTTATGRSAPTCMVADRLAAIVRRHGRERLRRLRPSGRGAAGARARRARPARAGGGLPRLSGGPGRARGPAGAGLAARIRRAGWPRPPTPTSGCSRRRADDERRARAIWSVARVYDAAKLYVAARDTYLELAARYPRSGSSRDGATVAELVAREAGARALRRLVADRRRAADRRRRGPPLALGGPGRPGGPGAEHRGGRLRRWRRAGSSWAIAIDLRLLDRPTAPRAGRAELGSPAVWAGYLDDKLIAAGPARSSPSTWPRAPSQWRYRPGAEREGASRARPVRRGREAADEPPTRPGATLHGFRLVKGRVFCLRGAERADRAGRRHRRGRLVVLRAARARSIPTSGSAPDRIVLQVDRPNQLLVLRTDDGQPVARTPLGDGGSARTAAPAAGRGLRPGGPRPADGQEARPESRPDRLGVPRERGPAGQRRRPA